MLEHLRTRAEKPARTVVIGAGGFVGSSILRELARAGMHSLGISSKDVDLLAGNAAQRLAEKLEQDDAVVFVSAVAPAKTGAQLITNLRMAEAACEAFKAKLPGQLVYISSDAVYADDANPVTERSALAPSTIHGAMHAARELMFRTSCPAPLACLRPTLIYGARDPHSGYGPNRFRRQAAEGKPIAIFGEGEEKRDHVAVEDVARLAALMLLWRSKGALNAVTGTSVSFQDVARMIASHSNAKVVSMPRPGPRPHLTHRFFDIAGCHKAFPDFRFETLAAGLARVHREMSAGPG